jgi:hypothetical protein
MTKISNQYSLTNILTADLANSRLGINTSSPSSQLHIIGTTGNAFTDGIRIGRNVNSTTQYCIINQNGGEMNITTVDVSGNLTPQISFYRSTNGSSSTHSMTIDKNGNVGIGTTSVTTNKLVVEGYGTANSIMTYPVAKFYGSGTGGLNIGTDGTNPQIATDNSGTDLTFLTRVSGVFYERMRITSGGSLCIGTTSASFTATGRGNVTIGGSTTSILAFQPAGTGRSYIYHNGSSFFIENEAAGGVYVNSGTGSVVLANGSSAWAASSDERLKNINYNIENAVDKLSSLRTVNFSWKSDQTKKEFLGLIAQDVEKVFPQVISKNNLPSNINDVQIDKTEYLSVRYTELIPVLVKAVQELSAEIDILKQEIINLKNK